MKTFIAILFFLVVFLLFSCRNDNFYNGNNQVLTFSTDTLTFDTIFTTVGSITRYFKVENTSKQTLLIEEIRVVQGESSPFRINVDGISVPSGVIENVEIPARDYIYIFVEATLGENNVLDPFVIINELKYSYNGVAQSSYLQAWGQDAYFHFGEIYTNENVVWNNDKPHVIVRNGSFPGVGIDSFSTLSILPGTKIFTSFGAGIFVDGELNIGQTGNPDTVTLRSDRIEVLPNGFDYADASGLWYGIAIFDGGKANLHNVVIEQATYGITGRFVSGRYNTYSNASRPEINLDKVVIKKSQQHALIALNSKLTAKNCLFYGAGNHLVVLALGGDYEIDNCTFYNSGGFGLSHQNATLALSNFAQNQNGGAVNALVKADITNTIVYGTLSEEILLSELPQGAFNFEFKNCLLKTELDLSANPKFVNCIANQNPLFENISDSDYRLKNGSPCIDAGFNNGISDDLDFLVRTPPIDIGCFEF